jgi:hypothetical protein
VSCKRSRVVWWPSAKVTTTLARPADGCEVGVEGRQEQVVGLFDAADGGLGDAESAGELGLGELGGLPEGG